MEESIVYKWMDWAGIEALVYSEHDDPHQILGPHVTEDGILISAYVPEAQQITVVTDKGKEYPMICEDEGGYFAQMLPGKKIPSYRLRAVLQNGSVEEYADPYAYKPIITEEDEELFSKGIHYSVYEKLGAHVMTVNGVTGTGFAVWAPNSMRVSVVGNFNQWDGRRHQMRRLPESGIFELFIPGVAAGEIYKFEIKAKGGLTYLKADPYANASELRPANASVVADISGFRWSDSAWMAARKKTNLDEQPVSIYEVHLGSFRKPEEKNGSFYNYRELAVMLADYVTKMGYTHIELMPVMEHPFDGSWGYQVTGYYSVTSRYGTPEDFMYFMNYMHEHGIGVILDWVPAHFPRDTFGLSNFDGTCLYEHLDPRQGSHPHWGTLIYNYGRPQVANFLIANALFWVEKYHADAIRMDAVASMLYLDYGKNDGEWIANKYGSNENLEAIELLRHLNSVFHKRKDGAVLIAEESTAWPEVTDAVENGGLGFDFKWNMGWMNDFTNYMKQDPIFRKGYHGALTFSLVYAYSEKFILVLSHDEVVHGKASMLYKMPGSREQKFANLRLAYGFMTAHPGKKLLFMGQEFAQTREWSEDRSLDWNLLEYEDHKKMQQYSASLNEFYKKHPAMYQLDHKPEGFEWISSLDADHSIISFVRKSAGAEEVLFIICNFTPVVYDDYHAAVPAEGKYKEIFNSDAEQFGGTGMVNSRVKTSKKGMVDGQEQFIPIVLPPLAIAVFTVEASPVSSKNGTKKEIKKLTKKDTKSAETKAAKKPSDGATETAAKKPVEKKAAKKAASPKAAAPKAAEEKPEKTAEEKAESKASKAAEEKPDTPAETKAAKKPSADTTETAVKKPVEKKAVKKAAKEKPESKASKAAEEKPDTLAETKAAQKPSADTTETAVKKPVEKKAAKKTAEEKPKSKASKAAEEKPEQAAAPKAAEEKPEQAAAPKAAEEKPDTPAETKAAKKKTARKTETAARPVAEKTEPAAGKPAAKKAAGKKTADKKAKEGK